MDEMYKELGEPKTVADFVLQNNAMLKIMLSNQVAILKYLDEIHMVLKSEGMGTDEFRKLREEMLFIESDYFDIAVRKKYLENRLKVMKSNSNGHKTNG